MSLTTDLLNFSDVGIPARECCPPSVLGATIVQAFGSRPFRECMHYETGDGHRCEEQEHFGCEKSSAVGMCCCSFVSEKMSSALTTSATETGAVFTIRCYEARRADILQMALALRGIRATSFRRKSVIIFSEFNYAFDETNITILFEHNGMKAYLLSTSAQPPEMPLLPLEEERRAASTDETTYDTQIRMISDRMRRDNVMHVVLRFRHEIGFNDLSVCIEKIRLTVSKAMAASGRIWRDQFDKTYSKTRGKIEPGNALATTLKLVERRSRLETGLLKSMRTLVNVSEVRNTETGKYNHPPTFLRTRSGA